MALRLMIVVDMTRLLTLLAFNRQFCNDLGIKLNYKNRNRFDKSFQAAFGRIQGEPSPLFAGGVKTIQVLCSVDETLL